MSNRREKTFGATVTEHEGIQLTVTRRGIEVDAWYDGMVGIEPVALTWDEIDAARSELAGRAVPRGVPEP